MVIGDNLNLGKGRKLIAALQYEQAFFSIQTFFLKLCFFFLNNGKKKNQGIPAGCILWSDGCNYCEVQDGALTNVCSDIQCAWEGVPGCLDWEGLL